MTDYSAIITILAAIYMAGTLFPHSMSWGESPSNTSLLLSAAAKVATSSPAVSTKPTHLM